MFAYAFPPICLIPRVIQHMKQFQCKIILILATSPLVSRVAGVVSCSPTEVTSKTKFVATITNSIFSSNPAVFNLTAWLLSTDFSFKNAFLNRFKHCSQPVGELLHKKTTHLNLPDSVAGVLKGRWITVSHITCYRSRLSAVLRPVSNISVRQHPYITRLLKGFCQFKATSCNIASRRF